MTSESQSTHEYEYASCDYFTDGICRSCSLLAIPSGDRIGAKERRLRGILEPCGISPDAIGSMITPDTPWQSRRKIKMTVTGTFTAPCLGIVRSDLSSADLTDCPLTPEPIRQLVRELKKLIGSHKLEPYSITARRGELKHIIVMADQAISSAIVRFIVRSTECVPRLRKCVAALQEAFPWIQVVSCNIQPLPAALLEGPEEILLTPTSHIREVYGDIPLYLSPQSFMQVTPVIATRLYQRAAAAAANQGFKKALDLYCGAGGFSLHLAKHVERVMGVEVSQSAIASAQRSAAEIGASNANFMAAAVEHFLTVEGMEKPDLILVNPPRRGLTEDVTRRLRELNPAAIFYSSCNPETFARDSQAMARHYDVTSIDPFDMFPMTEHIELFAVLRSKSA
jgi:23S rRNA (uracil747-C5)-methyltransferase